MTSTDETLTAAEAKRSGSALMTNDIAKTVAGYQIELFQHVGEFFGRATGMGAVDFSTIDGFGDRIRRDAHFIGHRGEDAFRWADRELRAFYARRGREIFQLAKRLGGMKLVLGGSSRFAASQLASVRGSLLYADTVLIPDPVYPWLEVERSEEQFRHVLMLQAAHTLLYLKPIVDSDLTHCPILVFPSWEKSLEQQDKATIDGTQQMIADVFANYVNPDIRTMDDAARMAREHPQIMLAAIEQQKLFVAPGGPIGEPVVDALSRYEQDVRTWRSNDWMTDYNRLPQVGRVMNAVCERLQPQYHLLENAEELLAHPLLAIKQQAHYYGIVSHVNSERLTRLGLLDQKTRSMLTGLQSTRLEFLSDLPLDALVEMRRNNDNEVFRKRMISVVGGLHESSIEDLDRIAAEMCREIDSGIADYNRAVRDIDGKYRIKNTQTLATGAITSVSLLWPNLAPFIGPALPFAVAAKLGWDAWEKYNEKKKISRSLMGMLAVAKDQQSH